jgi:hypothetical protein
MKSNLNQEPRKVPIIQSIRLIAGRVASPTLLALVLTGAAVGCDFPDMRPGERCGSCHNGGEAGRFGAAGTVYASPTAGKDDGIAGVTVDLLDSTGGAVSLTSNDSGNFYTGQHLVPPLQVTLSRAGSQSVSSVAPNGDCNSCHTGGATLGRLHIQ